VGPAALTDEEVAVVQETATGIARALLALTAAEITRSRRSLLCQCGR
jgi:hypothetical protein